MDTVVQSDEQPLGAGRAGEVQAVPLFHRRGQEVVSCPGPQGPGVQSRWGSPGTPIPDR